MTLAAHIDPTDIDPSVRCSDCEAVCCRLQVILMPGDHIPEHYTDHDDSGLEVMARADDGWCVALDRNTMRCTIYEQRPILCREYAMGSRDCRDERAAWRRIPLVCL